MENLYVAPKTAEHGRWNSVEIAPATLWSLWQRSLSAPDI